MHIGRLSCLFGRKTHVTLVSLKQDCFLYIFERIIVVAVVSFLLVIINIVVVVVLLSY